MARFGISQLPLLLRSWLSAGFFVLLRFHDLFIVLLAVVAFSHGSSLCLLKLTYSTLDVRVAGIGSISPTQLRILEIHPKAFAFHFFDFVAARFVVNQFVFPSPAILGCKGIVQLGTITA